MYRFNINNISTYIYGDGKADVNGGNSGFEFPKGSNKYAVYQSGLLWGGREDGGLVRIGGTTFATGLVQGKVGQDPEESRMYRVRPDWEFGSMISEIRDEENGGDEDQIRDQYKLDWLEWPWRDGAAYLDANQNGIYDPNPDGNGSYDFGEDIPGKPGSAQTIFFIANNADDDKARQFYGSPPTSFEMRVTVWGYSFAQYLTSTIFKEYIITNKNDKKYTDLYFGIWCDPDIGNAGDDFIGCDTLLNLGFAYNADVNDSNYGENPPASGHVFLAHPGEEIKMTSFFYFKPYSYGDDWDNYNTGTLYHYNALKGLIPSTGIPFPIPEILGGGVTRFPLSGDPVSGEGYIDGILFPAGDRRYMMSIGPYQLNPNETYKITFAQIAAGGSRGVNNYEAITILKDYAKQAQIFANNGLKFPKPQLTVKFEYTSLSKKIELKWSNEAEGYSQGGYEFQGYNIYQLPRSGAQLEEGIKIKTFDKIDGVRVIKEDHFEGGNKVTSITQAGNDWGIEHELHIEKDYLRNTELHPGSEYYYTITSYNYSESPWAGQHSFESDPTYVTVTMGENAVSDIEKTNVFPNPYYGANPNELNKYQRYVTFSHLPEQATIKIFNLAGQLVKTIYKSEAGQFQRWDLMNEFNILVPGGIYITYIEMPQLGETKILKLAIIPERIIPDWY